MNEPAFIISVILGSFAVLLVAFFVLWLIFTHIENMAKIRRMK
jgi:phage shock protein PspC (stress-responsive transcriptional regulator)